MRIIEFREIVSMAADVAGKDYHACIGEREVKSWKKIAFNTLEMVRAAECKRATAYDKERQQSAISALESRLEQADERIEGYREEAKFQLIGLFNGTVFMVD